MKYPEYLYGAMLNSVGNDVRVVGYYQFSHACDSSSASQVRMFLQLLNTGEYMHEKSFGAGRTFFRNVFGFVRQVGQRSRQLLNLHTSLWLLRDLCPMQTPQHRLPSALV